jgi:hypothetical protein
MRRVARITVVVLLTLGLASGTAVAQRYLVVGNVQWTSANRLQVMTDGGVSVNLDVSRLDQTSYTSLRVGDRVRVVGYLGQDRLRIVAESLELDEWTAPQTP